MNQTQYIYPHSYDHQLYYLYYYSIPQVSAFSQISSYKALLSANVEIKCQRDISYLNKAESPQVIVKNSNFNGKSKNIISQQEKLRKRKRINKKRNLNQKDDRNVYSNLLRLLFKNILEVKLYDQQIYQIIKRFKLQLEIKDFYSWLWSCKVNFQNYISLSSVNNLFTDKHSNEKKLILRVITNKFLQTYCTSHTLTSKRIVSSSIKIHLQGAKDMKIAIFHPDKI